MFMRSAGLKACDGTRKKEITGKGRSPESDRDMASPEGIRCERPTLRTVMEVGDMA